MKTVTLLLLVFIASTLQTLAQGEVEDWILYTLWQSEFPMKIACADSAHCMVIGRNQKVQPYVRRTIDGVSWDNVHLGPFPIWLGHVYRYRDLAHPTPRLCLVGADSGTVLRTTNAGITWNTFDLGTDYPVWNVAMADSMFGVVAAYDRMWKTYDGGETWLPVQFPDIHPVVAILEVPEPEVIVARMGDTSDNGLFRSTDGGESWRRGSLPEYTGRFNFDDLDFIDRDTGWACGGDYVDLSQSYTAYDVVHHTTDGGMTWTQQLHKLIEPTQGLRALDFFDSRNGIAVGNAGKILRTTDGGETWRQEQTGLSRANIQPLGTVAFPHRWYAYIFSATGHLFKKGDGHGTWPEDVAAVAIDENADEGTVIAPNPIRRGMPIRVTLRHEGSERAEIAIVDLLGRIVARRTESEPEAGARTFTIETEDLMPGSYFVTVRTGASRRTVPLIVE